MEKKGRWEKRSEKSRKGKEMATKDVPCMYKQFIAIVNHQQHPHKEIHRRENTGPSLGPNVQ
jgi:hypothetical protein